MALPLDLLKATMREEQLKLDFNIPGKLISPRNIMETFPTLSTLVKMHSGTPFYVASFPPQDISGQVISDNREQINLRA
jgi:hypothetical protein